MDPAIESARSWFREIFLKGIPFMLRQNDTAFLSFVCVVAATDALSGYRFRDDSKRFSNFVTEYFPDAYKPHADKLYLFRCRMVHNFSPAYFTVVHNDPVKHLQSSPRDTFLDDRTFFEDMQTAAEKYFNELHASTNRQADMLARLQDTKNGGSIFVASA